MPEPNRDIEERLHVFVRGRSARISFVCASQDEFGAGPFFEIEVCIRAARVGFERNGKIVAVASIFRDTESLQAEAAMRRGDFAAVAKLFD